MIGDVVFQIEPAKPSVSKVQPDLLIYTTLGSDAVAIADDQHPHQKFGIDRGPTSMAVVAGQLAMNSSKRFRHKHIDPAQQMRLWNTLNKVERVEELNLIGGLVNHYQIVLLANHPENGNASTPRI